MSVRFVSRAQNLGLVANIFKAIESVGDTDFVYLTAADDYLADDGFFRDALNTLDNRLVCLRRVDKF